jgi:hypothetical protein
MNPTQEDRDAKFSAFSKTLVKHVKCYCGHTEAEHGRPGCLYECCTGFRPDLDWLRKSKVAKESLGWAESCKKVVEECMLEIEALERQCELRRNRAKDAEIEAQVHKAKNGKLREVLESLIYVAGSYCRAGFGHSAKSCSVCAEIKRAKAVLGKG